MRVLERLGFSQVRQRGSHVVLKRVGPQGTTGCVVPLHPELAIGTLRGILRRKLKDQQLVEPIIRRMREGITIWALAPVHFTEGS